MKVINKQKFSAKETESLLREVEFLRELSHPHVVKFHDFFDENPEKSMLVRVVRLRDRQAQIDRSGGKGRCAVAAAGWTNAVLPAGRTCYQKPQH